MAAVSLEHALRGNISAIDVTPATMTLLGEANWWAPAPLRRLHHRLGLHEAPARPAALTGPLSEAPATADARR